MLTAEQVAKVSKDALRAEVMWLLDENTRLTREAAQQVTWERERIMREWTRRAAKPPARTEWMAPTSRLIVDGDGPAFGTLHVRDPAVPPHLAPPTTRRGRYLSGDVREAGPGSYIGKALCGWPMMADELWCSARGSLQHAVNHGRAGLCSCVELCGLCSYLSACPTLEAAWEAM